MLITGAANGLGRCMARHADQAGYRVGVLDINAEAAAQVAGELRAAVALEADVRDPTAVSAALDAFGEAPSALINNAGILRTGPLIDHPVDDFRLVVDINLTSVFIVGQLAAQRMREAGGGVIVNVASINGMHPSLNSGAYAAAKAGVIGLTQNMAVEWGAFGIRVNAIAPGFIDAGMAAPFYQDPTVRQRRGGAVPLKRLGTDDEVAQCALFLASDAASYISGQNIAIDGGVIQSVLAQLPRD
ncbi:MAG: SDR family oxidoreductase [Gammaproteobacteria bacterium]|nr:SDR family oxidoreductase [Gammaproteobacteria bacterium]